MNNALLELLEKNPKAALVIALFLVSTGGAGVGAFATKSTVDIKHEEAMNRINQIEIVMKSSREDRTKELQRLYETVSRIENKLDNYIIQGRHRY